MTKVCYRCKEEQPVVMFRKNSRRPDGLHSWCTPCFAKYEADRYKAGDNVRKKRNRVVTNTRAREYIWSVLIVSSCIDCGNSDPMVLEFDHIDDATKKHNVSEMFDLSVSKIKEEIAKCDVRCANCHRKRTAIQFGTWRSLQPMG